jgi:cellobiose-specific phosphotransferase system component IIB
VVQQGFIHDGNGDAQLISHLKKMVQKASKNKNTNNDPTPIKVSFVVDNGIVGLKSLTELVKEFSHENIQIEPMFIVPHSRYHKPSFQEMYNETGVAINVVDKKGEEP